MEVMLSCSGRRSSARSAAADETSHCDSDCDSDGDKTPTPTPTPSLRSDGWPPRTGSDSRRCRRWPQPRPSAGKLNGRLSRRRDGVDGVAGVAGVSSTKRSSSSSSSSSSPSLPPASSSAVAPACVRKFSVDNFEYVENDERERERERERADLERALAAADAVLDGDGGAAARRLTRRQRRATRPIAVSVVVHNAQLVPSHVFLKKMQKSCCFSIQFIVEGWQENSAKLGTISALPESSTSWAESSTPSIESSAIAVRRRASSPISPGKQIDKANVLGFKTLVFKRNLHSSFLHKNKKKTLKKYESQLEDALAIRSYFDHTKMTLESKTP